MLALGARIRKTVECITWNFPHLGPAGPRFLFATISKEYMEKDSLEPILEALTRSMRLLDLNAIGVRGALVQLRWMLRQPRKYHVVH